jgi:hypothetical protein
MAATNNGPLTQKLQSRNSSKSERTLFLDGTPMMTPPEEREKVLSDSSSQRSSRGEKNEAEDVEAQTPFDFPEPILAAQPDPNLVKRFPASTVAR